MDAVFDASAHIARGKKIRTFKNALLNVLCVALSMIILLPLYMVFINTFKGHGDATRMGLDLVGASFRQGFENYSTVIKDAQVLNGYKNSLIVTVTSSVILLVISCMAAYVVVRRGTRAMKTMNGFILSGMVMPGSIPIVYNMYRVLGLTSGNGGYIAAIMNYCAGVAFPFFLYVGFMKGLSREIDEAAIIDGVSPLGLFWRIIFPLLKPVSATLLIHCFQSSWNDFIQPLYYMNSPRLYTVVYGMYMYSGARTTRWDLLFTHFMLVAAPLIIVFLILQRNIVAGLTAGAVKG